MGLDSIHAVPRFTFGTFALYRRDILCRRPDRAFRVWPRSCAPYPSKDMPHRSLPSEVGRVIPPLAASYARYSPAAAIRSGILGTFIGAIPGAGANVASFLAYDIGRRRAAARRARESGGKGSYQALVCAETANNANIGGSMLPTLALGIPGNAAAAALLAALTLKNVNVGPTIEIDHPGPDLLHLRRADHRQHPDVSGRLRADRPLREAVQPAARHSDADDHPGLRDRRLCGEALDVRRLGHVRCRRRRLAVDGLPVSGRADRARASSWHRLPTKTSAARSWSSKTRTSAISSCHNGSAPP